MSVHAEHEPGLQERLDDVSAGEGHRLRNGLITLVILGAMAVALLLAVPGLRGVADRIRDANGWWLTAAIVLELASCVGYALAFQLVFRRAPLRLATRIAFAEMAFGAVLPVGGAGGIAVGAWIAKAKGGSLRRFMQRSAVLFLLTSAVNALTLAAAGLLALIGVLPISHPVLLGLVPGAVALGAVLAFLAVPSLARRFAPGDERRAVRWLHSTAGVIRDTWAELRHPRWRLIGAIAYLWCDIAVLWACFHAIGVTPSLGALVIGYQVGYLANIVPIPGGIGVIDGGVTAALVLYGIPAGQAAAAVIIYHAMVLWLPTLLGTIAFLRLRSTLHEPMRLRPEPD